MFEEEVEEEIVQTEEYVPFGNFIVSSASNEEVKESNEYVGYDYMSKMNIPYEDIEEYPTTVGDILQHICDLARITLHTTTFPNSDFVVSGNVFTNNETCRDVLAYIAQIAGGMAVINRSNELCIVCLDVDGEPVDEIDGNNYDNTFTTSKTYGAINTIRLKLPNISGQDVIKQDTAAVVEYGEKNITIEGNYFLGTQTAQRAAIDDIYDALNGLTYLPFKTDYYGYPYLDLGDKITIYDNNDTAHISYVLNHTFRYNGAFSGNLETPATSDTQKTSSIVANSNNAIKEKFRRVEINVDRVEGQIESVVEEIGDREGKTTTITQDIDTIASQVENTVQYKKVVEGITQVYIEDAMAQNAVKVEVQGNITYISGLYPRADLYPSSDLYVNMEGEELR